jgi:hypothetical protein
MQVKNIITAADAVTYVFKNDSERYTSELRDASNLKYVTTYLGNMEHVELNTASKVKAWNNALTRAFGESFDPMADGDVLEDCETPKDIIISIGYFIQNAKSDGDYADVHAAIKEVFPDYEYE